jgi:hypothetical protein
MRAQKLPWSLQKGYYYLLENWVEEKFIDSLVSLIVSWDRVSFVPDLFSVSFIFDCLEEFQDKMFCFES